jgi:hypothetical protein
MTIRKGRRGPRLSLFAEELCGYIRAFPVRQKARHAYLNLSLRHRAHRRAKKTSSADQLQLFNLPALRHAMGLLQGRYGTCVMCVRRHRKLYLGSQASQVYPVQDVRLRHALGSGTFER